MRLLPDSLMGRTALVLVAAVVLALGSALFFFASQRSEALAALGGRNAAERVAALAHLLEGTPPEGRRPLLRSMDAPGFRAGWGMAPLVQESAPHGLAAAVAEHLGHHLGGREVRVSTESGPGLGPPHHQPPPTGIGPGMGAGQPHELARTGLLRALRISVRLDDDSWLNVIAPLEPGDPLFRPRFLLPLLAALLAVTIAALWAVRRATKPFALFAAAAERLGLDVNAPPLPETGPGEVSRAAHAFNEMQGRIRRFVEDRTQMLAAISHDLRTPITRMRLRAEFVDDDEQRAKMLSDLDEMEHMIAATLAFARDDATREHRKPVDLAALVQGLAEDLGGTYDGSHTLVVQARPVALKRAMGNLIDNAMKYGGAARVALESQPRQVVVTIDDDGPGIPEAEFERVFAPFTRLEGSRNRHTGGTGLGLAVARAAARAHGGDILLANRPEGGLRVQLVLPTG